MIHILHHQTDEVVGWISKVLSDKHVNTIKNEESYDFVVSAEELGANLVNDRSRILIPAEDGDYQEFVVDYIYEDTQASSKEVYSVGSFMDLEKAKIINPQVLESQTVSTSANMVLDGLEWRLGIAEPPNIHKWTIQRHIGALDALKAIASLFECELRFRVTTDGYKITGRYVDFLKKQGMDRGKEIVYAKDLIGIKRKKHSNRIVTALYCLGPEKEDGTRLETIVTNDAAFQNWNRKGKHLIQIYEPESSDQDMTLERLTTLGNTELSKRIAAAVEYEIEQASIEHIFGYEHEKVRLGDVAKVKDEHFSPPMYLDSRVISMERSVFDKSKKMFKLGEVIEYKQDDIMRTWRDLQALYGAKVIKSPTAPAGRKNTVWVKAGGSVEIVHTWDGALNKWVPAGGSYTWTMYADDVNGTNMSPSPEGKKYIGLAFNQTDETPSTNHADYSWSLLQGPKGDTGNKGADAIGLSVRLNATTFTNTSDGELYFHGFDENGNKADVDGYVILNGEKLTIPKQLGNVSITGEYYLMFNKSDQLIYGVAVDKFMRFTKIRFGLPTVEFTPDANHVFFGVAYNSAVELVDQVNLWAGAKDYLEMRLFAIAKMSDSWRYQDTVEIDGANLRAKTVTAQALFVESLSAIIANLGKVTAGEIYGLTIETDKMTIKRPDGYPVVNNGMANFDFSVDSANPPFMDFGVSVEGYWFKTSNTVPSAGNFYTFKKTARYLKMQVAYYKTGSGNTAAIRIYQAGGGLFVAKNFLTDNTHQNAIEGEVFTIDLGAPDGSMISFYLQGYQDIANGSVYFRKIRAWLEG